MSKSSAAKKYNSKSVEIQDWFIGLITKATAERYLKKEGEYMVRTQEKNGGLQFVLSVRGDKECVHFTIIYRDGYGWALQDQPTKAFGTIVQLIEYYGKKKLPGEVGYLQQPFKKPNWFIRHENISYDFEKGLIGTGNFCDVYKGKLYGKISVAVKVCHGPTGEKQSADEIEKVEDAKESLIREACLMAEFKHSNIVRFHGICCDVPPVCIIMERCTGGALVDHLQQWANKITIGERIRYSLEAAKGMCYLQEKNLIHRDLAARNCLISKYGIIKISDFGLSQLVTELAGEPTKQRVPVRWMAPETIRKEPLYSIKSDVWSYGVLLYEIYNDGIKPWPELDVRRCATYIRQGNMPEMPGAVHKQKSILNNTQEDLLDVELAALFIKKTPPEVANLVSECWTMNVEKRCDFKYIVKKLISIQSSYSAPKPADLTLSKLKNVKTLTEKEAEEQEQKSEREKESLSKASPASPYDDRAINDMMLKLFSPQEGELSSIVDSEYGPKVYSGSRGALAKKRRKEREEEILNENLLECIEEEIKKMLASEMLRRRSRRRHRKHRRRKHRSKSSNRDQLKAFVETAISREDVQSHEEYTKTKESLKDSPDETLQSGAERPKRKRNRFRKTREDEERVKTKECIKGSREETLRSSGEQPKRKSKRTQEDERNTKNRDYAKRSREESVRRGGGRKAKSKTEQQTRSKDRTKRNQHNMKRNREIKGSPEDASKSSQREQITSSEETWKRKPEAARKKRDVEKSSDEQSKSKRDKIKKTRNKLKESSERKRKRK